MILNILLSITSLSFLLISSLLITSFFRFRSIIPFLINLYLIIFSTIVLISELAGLLNLLNNKYIFLTLQSLVLLVAYLFWRRKSTPDLIFPLRQFALTLKNGLLKNTFKKHFGLFVLGFGVLAIYGVGIFLIFKVPPNNWDSMTCHMTRIGYWLQHGNFLPWPTWDFTQQVYPFNAQVQMFWSILFWGSDTFAGFTQWFAAIIAVFAIYGIARLLGWSRPQSIFAGLLFSLFPEIVLESTTVQNHLVAASLVMCSYYFLFLGAKTKEKPGFLLSGIAIALALGTHQLVFFIIPGVLVTVLLLWKRFGRSLNKLTLLWAISGTCAFVLLGSFMYVQNYIIYGNFLQSPPSNPESLPTITEPDKTSNYWGRPKKILAWTKNNIERFIYYSLDTTGLPPVIKTPIYQIRETVGRFVFDLSKNPIKDRTWNLYDRNMVVTEDAAWAGIVGFLLIYPLMIIQGIKSIKNRDPMKLSLVLSTIIFVTVWSGLMVRDNSWTIYQGRYQIINAMWFTPLIASIYRKEMFNKILIWLLIGLSLFIASYTVLYNMTKPLISLSLSSEKNRNAYKFDSLNLTPADKRLAYQFTVGTQQYSTFKTINEIIPMDATLAYLFPREMFEYPLFGQAFSRTLFAIYPNSKLNDTAWLEENHVNWLLICKDLKAPTGFNEVKSIPVTAEYLYTDACKIYKRK